MTPFLEQARHSLRLLRRHKRFAALAMICLGVSIALNTTMYSVLDTMINPKVAMRDPKQLYGFRYFGDYRGIIPANERNAAVRDGATFHEDITGASYSNDVVERGRHVREVRVLTVLPNYFHVLGVQPRWGRLITPRDMGAESRPVVISERLWKQIFPDVDRFESAPILLGDQGRMVVGVLAYESSFPGQQFDVWQLPLPAEVAGITLSTVRLRAAVTPAQAEAELNTIALRFRQRTGPEDQAGYRFWSLSKPPFRAHRFHWALIGSVLSVLLIACANLANLQLARGVSRAREFATRSAVGAARRDIIVQLLMESAWLALGGLVLAAVLTLWAVRVVDASVPPSIGEFVTHTQLNWRVLGFAVGIMMLCLLLVGLAPAIRLSRVDIEQVLKSGAGTGRTVSARRQYGALVIIEVGLALSLLCSSALLVRAAFEVHRFRLGHDYDGLVESFVGVARLNASDRRSLRDWSDVLIQKSLKDTTIVAAATVIKQKPSRHAITVDDPGGTPMVWRSRNFAYDVVSPDYFRVMRYPIVRGRDFAPGEFAEPSVIVDAGMANLLWPGANPVGRLIKLDSAHIQAPWYRVIGVVRLQNEYFDPDRAEARQLARATTIPDTAHVIRQGAGSIYLLNAVDTAALPLPGDKAGFPLRGRQGRYTFMEVVIRGTRDALRYPAVLKRRYGELAPNVVMGFSQTWEQRSNLAGQRERQDFMAAVFLTFAAIALALAALGVYAIIAHMVAQRTREFGVRVAIGAAATDIREMVIREGNILTLTGIAAGLLLTYWTASLLRFFLFSDWDRYDSRVFAVACVVLFATAWLASYIPARRAMRINPVEALRND